MSIGCFHRHEREHMAEVELTRFQEATELGTKLRMEHQGMRRREPRHIEGLRRRHESNTVHACLLAHHGKRTVLVRRECEVGMDFIGEHEYAFFVADFGHLLEFFFGPHNATRVVRIAEDEHLASLHLLAEIVHIHAVSTIHQLQRIGYQSAIATGIQPRERTIYRRLDKHLVARIGKRFQRHAQARHDARHEVNHFLLHIESVAVLVPSDNGLEIAVRLSGIAQHRMFQTLADGFGYERCGGKVHIGHPKRNQVCASPNFFHIVYFHGRGAASVYHFIKIVFHSINCFSFPQK